MNANAMLRSGIAALTLSFVLAGLTACSSPNADVPPRPSSRPLSISCPIATSASAAVGAAITVEYSKPNGDEFTCGYSSAAGATVSLIYQREKGTAAQLKKSMVNLARANNNSTPAFVSGIGSAAYQFTNASGQIAIRATTGDLVLNMLTTGLTLTQDEAFARVALAP
jgi:hypothetical protein